MKTITIIAALLVGQIGFAKNKSAIKNFEVKVDQENMTVYNHTDKPVDVTVTCIAQGSIFRLYVWGSVVPANGFKTIEKPYDNVKASDCKVRRTED